jgi:hypothetical protein
MRHGAIVHGLLVASLLGACGGSDRATTNEMPARTPTQATAEASTSERALGLTRRLPAAYRRVCKKQARDAPAPARTCPPLIPDGPLAVTYRGRSLGRDSDAGGFSADLASRSLSRLHGLAIDTNGGHWRYDVVWAPAIRRAVVDTGIRRPQNATEPSSCRPTRVAGRPMTACRVVAHNRGGGLNGGHIAYVWDHAGIAYVLSVHGYANEPRARAMIAALAARVDP